MIYRLITATAFVFVANAAEAQSIESFLDGVFKPNRQVEKEIVQPVKRESRRHSHHIQHSGGSKKLEASWYSKGSRTANGERFNPNGLTAAHYNIKFGSKLKVTASNGKSVIVRVTDRGVGPGKIDLSLGAGRVLGIISKGRDIVSIDLL